MINWAPVPVVNIDFNKRLLNSTKTPNCDIFVVTNEKDVVSKIQLFNTISTFVSKKYNKHSITVNNNYDNSIIKIVNKLKSFRKNNIYVIASSSTTIFLIDAINKLNNIIYNKIKKIILISPHFLCMKNMRQLKNTYIDIIYGNNDGVVPVNYIESLSYESDKHVLYSIKNGNHSLENINLKQLNSLILSLIRN